MLIRRIIGKVSTYFHLNVKVYRRSHVKPYYREVVRTLYKIDIRISDETESESDERDMRAVLVGTAR